MLVALDLKRSRYFLYDGVCARAFSEHFLDLRDLDRSSILEPLVLDRIIDLSAPPTIRVNREFIFDYRDIRFETFDTGAWGSRTLGKRKTSKFETAPLLRIIKYSIMLRVFGFGALSALERLRLKSAITIESCAIDPVETIDRYLSASMWSPIHITCLPLSFSVVAHLRRENVPAQLVIGVRPTPFVAHAWVEIDGEVCGDDHDLKKSYGEIYRTPQQYDAPPSGMAA